MADRLRVLITDRPWPDVGIERDILAEVGAEIVEPIDATPEAIADLAPSADAIGVCWAALPGELLERCPRCRVVSRFGVGLDNVPVATAARLGIPVTWVPDYCVSEVADHTFALMLSLLRDVTGFDRSLKAGRYDSNRYVPRRLNGLTLGLVGYGRIGRAVAERAAAFGMTVIAANRQGSAAGVRQVSLDEVFAAADVVSLHLPLSEETRHLVGRERLSLMKSTAYLVNTSRGPLVDSAALLEALNSGRIAGAALDVFDPEPPASGDPLVSHPKVVATPHVAFRSAEAVVELRSRAARQIADVLSGRVPEQVVNPEVLGGPLRTRLAT